MQNVNGIKCDQLNLMSYIKHLSEYQFIKLYRLYNVY